MVHDNELLKRDNGELQRLLAESREEIHNLQEELEEGRINHPLRTSRSGGALMSLSSKHCAQSFEQLILPIHATTIRAVSLL